MNVIEANGIKRGFLSGSGMFWALKGVDIAVPQAKLTLLKGRSGSGKTTLMNILGALDNPTEGEVFFLGESLNQLSEKKKSLTRRNSMGFVFQSIALVSMMTAYENVEFMLRVSRFSPEERAARAKECLQLVGLGSRMNHFPQELSGGEQQRVAIARGVAHKPKIIFADEPTAELDTNTGLQVMKIFKDLIEKEKIAVVISTHDPGLMDIADRIYELEDGELL